MAINSNINELYPISGINQSSQGLRDNFLAAKTEITNLQKKTILITGDFSGISSQFGSGTAPISFNLELSTQPNLVPLANSSNQIVYEGITFDTKGRIVSIEAGSGARGWTHNFEGEWNLDAADAAKSVVRYNHESIRFPRTRVGGSAATARPVFSAVNIDFNSSRFYGGTGYRVDDMLVLPASDTQSVIPTTFKVFSTNPSNRAITAIQVLSSALGFRVGDVFTLENPRFQSNSSKIAVVSVSGVNSLGEITSLQITNGGLDWDIGVVVQLPDIAGQTNARVTSVTSSGAIISAVIERPGAYWAVPRSPWIIGQQGHGNGAILEMKFGLGKVVPGSAGVGYTADPSVTILGDGIGATVNASHTNAIRSIPGQPDMQIGYVNGINVVSAGSGYNHATIIFEAPSRRPTNIAIYYDVIIDNRMITSRPMKFVSKWATEIIGGNAKVGLSWQINPSATSTFSVPIYKTIRATTTDIQTIEWLIPPGTFTEKDAVTFRLARYAEALQDGSNSNDTLMGSLDFIGAAAYQIPA